MAKKNDSNGANLGFEATLWAAADKLRNNMDAAEYKHVVLGLIFLKYISDAFDEQYDKLSKEKEQGADPEDRDEYKSIGVFWVPKEARWEELKKNARQPNIGKLVDEAMDAIEKENPSLKGVLPKDYARPSLDKQRLGELIDLFTNRLIIGTADARSKDVLGRVYEYFLSQFASAEGKQGGQFYTPRCIVQLLVEMLAPYHGRVYDPCCGSGGMFVQSEKFIEAHGGLIGDISVYGQESNPTTWKLAKMNLAIRGIDGNLGPHNADTFHNDLHPDLKADYILANPPFNDSDWGGERLKNDSRWSYGIPPKGNANFAWVQHFIHHLAPTGQAGFVLANGSMSSQQSGEGEIRKNIIEADLVDCIVALPGQLFYSTGIPACLWFLARDKKNNRFRKRQGEILFIDARRMGHLIDRTHRELVEEDIDEIAGTYHAWRGDTKEKNYQDVAGFCKSVSVDEIAKQRYVLTPGRYVGSEAVDGNDEPFEDTMEFLTTQLRDRTEKGRQLDNQILSNLEELGFDERIEISLCSNQTLEFIAHAIFKSWFIDFDPVRAKAQGERPFGMDEETASLFPSEFEESELGDIPKGWSVQTLADNLIADKGLSYKGDFLSSGNGVPMHNLNSIYEGGGYKYEGIKYYTGEYKQRHKLTSGDIIVANTEQGFDYLLIGYPAIVPRKFGERGIFSHHIFRLTIKPGSNLKTHFLYYLLMSSYVREQIIACTNGTTVNMLSADGLRAPRIIVPPSALILRFERLALPIFQKIETSHEDVRTVAALRDAPPPTSLPGEICTFPKEAD